MSTSQPPTSAPPPSITPAPPSTSITPLPQPIFSPPPPTDSSPPPPTDSSPPPPTDSSPPTPDATPGPPALPGNPSPPRGSPPSNSSGPSGSGKTPQSSGGSLSVPSSSSSSTSAGLVVGLVVVGVAVLLFLGVLWICCYRKKRRPVPVQLPPSQSNGAPSSGKDELYGHNQNWHSTLPTADHVVKLPSNPSPSHPHMAGHFGVPPPIIMSNSGGTAVNHSGTDNGQLPPSQGVSLGLSKNTFTYEELAMATDGFSDANLLGQGGFGYVHRGMLANGKEVAVKQLKFGSGQGEREFQAEVEIISRVHHRYLVSLVGYCMSEGKRLLVYDFVPNNTLEFHLHGRGRPPLNWSSRLKIALGSAKGIAYLHEDCHPKIIHRDIKASNILLDFKFEAKVADFGLAKIASETDTHVSTRVMGTFGYLAPEYASSGKLTDKSDVFSFGVMLLELITGRRPFDSSHSFMDDSLVDWARPLLMPSLDDGKFDFLVDPLLGNDYNHREMRQMIACAAASIRYSAKKRPRMSQIVRALEGGSLLDDLNEGGKPGHSSVFGSNSSSDYDAVQYNEDMRKFRKMALTSQDSGSGSYCGPTS